MKPLVVMSIFGTRPEAIKMAPVIKSLEECPDVRSVVCVTSQHREMLDQVLDTFDIRPDDDLSVMAPNQGLADLTCAILGRLDAVFAAEDPDLVLVQGDTTTTFVAALAAFYRQVPVGHIEAGLRTGNRYAPFPEELNRCLTTQLSSLHFAPTIRNREALLGEGVADENIVVTGNTVIDALQWVVAKHNLKGLSRSTRDRLLVTVHRRETWGHPLEDICGALLDILAARPSVEMVLPVHLNPNVRATIKSRLGGHARVTLTEPLDYLSFVEHLAGCDLVLTDSGGVQEEAPALGKPVLVLRNETERQEAIDAGTARLVGVDRARIVSSCLLLIDDVDAYDAMSRATNPYGIGDSARRIAEAIVRRFRNSPAQLQSLQPR